MNKVIDKLPALVAEELEAANDIHSFFHSPHEGYAVLLEEVEEAQEEMRQVNLDLDQVWRDVRSDNPVGLMQWVKGVERDAVKLAAEAIQVAAMARKMQISLGRTERHEG